MMSPDLTSHVVRPRTHAWQFQLSDAHTGATVAHALVCVGAHYAGVRWLDAERVEHRMVEQADWRMVELAFVAGLPVSALDSRHAVPTILLPAEQRTTVAVRLVKSMSVPTAVTTTRTIDQLDAMLQSLTAEDGSS